MENSSTIFEAYLKCRLKCWYLYHGEKGSGNVYAEWLRQQNSIYCTEGIRRLTENFPIEAIRSALPEPKSVNSANWRFAAVVHSKAGQTGLHAVERQPLQNKNNTFEFIPIRFNFLNKLSKTDRLLVAFDAVGLSVALNCEVTHGKIVHGSNYAQLKIKTLDLMRDVRKIDGKIRALVTHSLPPELILNRHCIECDFQSICRQKAIEKDDLSLLGGMTEKERKKLNSKGIFTITQLSYTFRPRRRSKKMLDKNEKYHHSLKALAIRENKIHIVGELELKVDGTPVYLDVEGIPDMDFYYLIGIRTMNAGVIVQHSLWADSPTDEKVIWKELLEILSNIENPVIIHYGSFETLFLKRMFERYEETETDKLPWQVINLLSTIYAQVYFPRFSNGLKDVADSLGFTWTDVGCSGIQSIVWRNLWQVSHDTIIKEKLLRYNAQDCEALELLTDSIRQLYEHTKIESTHQIGETSFIRADSDRFLKKSKWQNFTSPIAALEYINSASHWNYQRERVHVRSEIRKKQNKRVKPAKLFNHVEKTVVWERTRHCPVCHRSYYLKGPERSRTLHEIIYGRRSMKLRLVKYIFRTNTCRKCGTKFGMPERFGLSRKYGWNLIAYFFYQIVDLGMPQRTVVQHFNKLFGFELSRSTLYNLKIRAADYYTTTKQQIIDKIINGNIINIDETRANIKGKAAFVWVLASDKEVVYFLSDSREGEIAHKLLANFKGILISDFYTAYDSIDCPQQKCLIHLMRDLNDDVLNYPFDDQLKQIVIGFGETLKPIIETVDHHGLKKYFFKKHLSRVDQFYQSIERLNYQSEASQKVKERLLKNKGKLFTFLHYDNVPWNNNNAEHAVKAFAKIRDVIEGSSTEKGTEEYLTLLSVCQTCKYGGLDFFEFIRSGEKDIYKFAELHSSRKRRGSSVQQDRN
jgi:predicted RecB family nuclease